MELDTLICRLEELQKKLFAFGAASSSLYLDAVTVAPRDTAEGRGVALSILAGETHKLMTAPETKELLESLKEKKTELDPVHARELELLCRSYDQISRIPIDEYMAYTTLVNEAEDVWHRAKETSDFALFQPCLEKLVAYNRKFAGYYDSTKAPYDALLNEYERGLTMEKLDQFFDTLRSRIAPLVKEIQDVPQMEDSFLFKTYPAELQRKLSDYLMEIMGLDRGHCGIGETEHPFTLAFTSQDVRITTNYQEQSLASSMYSVIHEGGHALYCRGVDPSFDYTVLTDGTSMGVHESQSRFYENLIGRSRPFVHAIFPKLRELFPQQLEGVTEEGFYLAVNKAQPSLIRTEADELTYSLHVMVRYEIEKQLIGGTLEVKDVPETWNRLYKEYLGVDVPSDAEGCLQDSHWSGGSFGYFPSYALGSAYGAQMLQAMEKEIDVWGPVAQGDLSKVTAWLREHVHKYGRFLEPAEVVEKSAGTFDPTVFTDYLEKKFRDIYGL